MSGAFATSLKKLKMLDMSPDATGESFDQNISATTNSLPRMLSLSTKYAKSWDAEVAVSRSCLEGLADRP
jgi:hypothetical protein